MAIGLFYGAGLMWGEHTHISMVEYWRWWVVHLWVEGFFEVFATAVIAFLFTRLGLLKVSTATIAVLDGDAAAVSITATADGDETGPVDGLFTVTQSATSAGNVMRMWSRAITSVCPPRRSAG